jgi:hypothetical protein
LKEAKNGDKSQADSDDVSELKHKSPDTADAHGLVGESIDLSAAAISSSSTLEVQEIAESESNAATGAKKIILM